MAKKTKKENNEVKWYDYASLGFLGIAILTFLWVWYEAASIEKSNFRLIFMTAFLVGFFIYAAKKKGHWRSLNLAWKGIIVFAIAFAQAIAQQRHFVLTGIEGLGLGFLIKAVITNFFLMYIMLHGVTVLVTLINKRKAQ